MCAYGRLRATVCKITHFFLYHQILSEKRKYIIITIG